MLFRKTAFLAPGSNDSTISFEPFPKDLPVTLEGKPVSTAKLDGPYYFYDLPAEIAGDDHMTEFVYEPVYLDPRLGFPTRWQIVAIRILAPLC